MWFITQSSPLDPNQWAPYGLGAAATFIAWFLLALKQGWLKWGSDCQQLVDYWQKYAEQMRQERDEARRTQMSQADIERQLRDRIEEKLSRANEELAAAAAALERRMK